MLIKQNIPVPVGGVSSLPPELRGPGYADEMVNAFPSPVRGLGVRQGSVARATALGAVNARPHIAEFAPTDDERYLILFDANGVRVIDADTGSTRPVTYGAPEGPFLSTGKFASVTVDDTLFVASRGYSKAQLTGPVVPTPLKGALVTVETGQPSALYKITLDGIEVSVRTPDDPPPAVKRPAIGLTVNNANPGDPNIALTGATSTLVYQKGGTPVTRDFSVTTTGITDSVVMQLTGLPAGVAASFSPATLPASSSNAVTTMTVNVDDDVAVTAATTIGVYATAGAHQSDTVYFTLDIRNAGQTDPTPPVGDFSLIANGSASATVQQGAAVVMPSWSVVPSGGFTSMVFLSMNPATAPAGLSAVFDPSGIYPTGTGASVTTSVPTVTADAAVTPGTYNLQIRGSCAGYEDAIGLMTITVSTSGGDTGETGTFTASSQASVSVPTIGTNVTFPVTISRSGFNGLVELDAVSTEPMLFVSFYPDPAGATDGTVTATVTTDPALPVGSYSVTLSASATGQPTVTWTVTINAGTT